MRYIREKLSKSTLILATIAAATCFVGSTASAWVANGKKHATYSTNPATINGYHYVHLDIEALTNDRREVPARLTIMRHRFSGLSTVYKGSFRGYFDPRIKLPLAYGDVYYFVVHSDYADKVEMIGSGVD